MVKNRQAGFTLVEVSIVLAITASMAVIVINSLSGLRGEAQFRGTVEDAASYLGSVRTNAMTSLSASGSGATPTRVIYGELLTITPGGTGITVTDMYGSNAAGGNLAANAPVDTITLGSSVTHSLTLQAKIHGIIPGSASEVTGTSPYYIVLHRTLAGGQLLAYDFGEVAITNVTSTANYNEQPDAAPTGAMAKIEPIKIKLSDISGNHTGIVLIDGESATITSGGVN